MVRRCAESRSIRRRWSVVRSGRVLVLCVSLVVYNRLDQVDYSNTDSSTYSMETRKKVDKNRFRQASRQFFYRRDWHQYIIATAV